MREGRLSGRRVLVVGAGTQPSDDPDPPVGNGRAIAVTAAREGAAVVCADRDRGAAEQTGAWITDEGGTSEVVVCDVTSEDDCAELVARATEDQLDSVSEPAGALHHRQGCATPSHRRRRHRVRQLRRRPPAWQSAPRVRRLESRAHRAVPPRRPRGRPAWGARQRRRAGPDRHAPRPIGVAGPPRSGANTRPARPARISLGSSRRHRLLAVGRRQLHHRAGLGGGRRPHPDLRCHARPAAPQTRTRRK